MVALHNLKKILRFGSSTSSFSFASRSRRFVAGDPTLTCFSLQSHNLLCTHMITSQDENFTVNYLISSCGLSRQGAILASKRFKLQSQERAYSILVNRRNHGFSETQISQVVRSHPQILACNFEKTILPKLQYFTSIGVSTGDVARMVAFTPMLLSHSSEKQLIPTHKLLSSMLPHNSVVVVLRRDGRIFMGNHSTGVLPNISLLRQ